MEPLNHQQIPLRRDCVVTLIPSGERELLPAGMEVMLMQGLGGHYTVVTPNGQMVRVDEKDVAEVLGEELAQASGSMDAPVAPDAPFEEEKVWEQLRTVYDPEIPVNVVDLGLIYLCQAKPHPEGGQRVEVHMTMTAPGCGMGGILKEDVRRKVLSVPGVREAAVEVVWDPPWDQGRMSEVARLELGWM